MIWTKKLLNKPWKLKNGKKIKIIKTCNFLKKTVFDKKHYVKLVFLKNFILVKQNFFQNNKKDACGFQH